MKKRFLTLLSFGFLLCSSLITNAQTENPSEFTLEQKAEIEQLTQKYLQLGFEQELARERAETVIRDKYLLSSRSRLPIPPSTSLWVNRDPDNPVNKHPVYDTATPEELVKNVLLADPLAQSRITNVSFTGTSGNNRSLAYFENGNGIGIPNGLILGTYNVENAEAPNTSSGALGGGATLTGDLHLTSIATASVQGGSILQFDFQPYSETVTFDFIFASEEYPDYSNQSVNDAFGFFIFEQGNPGNFTNIALFPNGDPVTINNSNWGYWRGGNTQAAFPAPLTGTYPALAVNPQWHVPNYEDRIANSDSIMEYDGRTIKLKASANALDTTKTYTLKLAICNISDNSYGSAVFLANLDLGTPTGNVETDFDNDGGSGWETSWDDEAITRNDYYEGCTQRITFDVTKHLTQDRYMHFDFKPSSMRNFMMVNNETFPDSVFIPKGSEEPVSMDFTVQRIPSDMEGVRFTIETFYMDIGTGARGPGDTTYLTFYNHPEYDIKYATPTTNYNGILELNISGGTPYLMRSLNKGVTWKAASAPISKSEIYNLSLEEQANVWLKEPNSCWDIVIPVRSDTGTSPIYRPVKVPPVENAVINYLPGIYYVPSMGPFVFTIQPTGANAGMIPVVTTNRTNVPDSEGVIIEDIGNGIFRVTIRYIQQPINFQIDFTTGNEQIDMGNHVRAINGELYITADAGGNASVYSPTGSLVRTVAIPAGETVNISLPAGFYIVTVNNKSYKIVLK